MKYKTAASELMPVYTETAGWQRLLLSGLNIIPAVNVDVFTCLNFHLLRCHPMTKPRYAAFLRLADEKIFCVKFVDI